MLTQHSSRDVLKASAIPLDICFVKEIELHILTWRDQGGLNIWHQIICLFKEDENQAYEGDY